MSTNQLADTHGAVQDLLPWFANGTLAADEMALVREHLRECPQCRDDAALQQRLRAAEPGLPPGLDPERALARLMPQLGPQMESQLAPQMESQLALQGAAQPAMAATARPPAQPSADGRLRQLAARWRAFWFGGSGWMPWALAGQGVLIAGLAFRLLPGETSDYRALSNGGAAPPPAGNVVVVFRPDAQLGQVQQILQTQGARVVDGPTVTGAYVLDVPDANQAQALTALKAYPVVQLAEPLSARRAP